MTTPLQSGVPELLDARGSRLRANGRQISIEPLGTPLPRIAIRGKLGTFARPTRCANRFEVIASQRNRGKLARSSLRRRCNRRNKRIVGSVELDGFRGRIQKEVLKRHEEVVPLRSPFERGVRECSRRSGSEAKGKLEVGALQGQGIQKACRISFSAHSWKLSKASPSVRGTGVFA